MSQATAYGTQSPEFLSLAYLYFTLRDRLTFQFVTEFIWPTWQKGSTRLTNRDAMRFIRDLADDDQAVFWRGVSNAPADVFGSLSHRFRELDLRLQRMEAHVTSREFDIDRELNRGHQGK